MTQIAHPYFPPDAEIPAYMPNELHVLELLSIFAAVATLVLACAALFVKRKNPLISHTDLATALWFVISGCLHCFFEGYFVLNHRTIAGSQSIPAQLWKEYSLSDSRYLTGDTFVLSIESATATTLGPLCLLTALLISTAHPLRHPFQLAVSVCHLYGTVLYYATSSLSELNHGISYSRPGPLYFYCYYVLTNAFWIVVPAGLVRSSIAASRRAFEAVARAQASRERVNSLPDKQTKPRPGR